MKEPIGVIAALLAFSLVFLLPILAMAFLIECIILPRLNQ